MRHATSFLIFLIFAGCMSRNAGDLGTVCCQMITEEEAIRNESLAGSYRPFGGASAGGGPGFVSVGGAMGR
jgi:hypothetical protein